MAQITFNRAGSKHTSPDIEAPSWSLGRQQRHDNLLQLTRACRIRAIPVGIRGSPQSCRIAPGLLGKVCWLLNQFARSTSPENHFCC